MSGRVTWETVCSTISVKEELLPSMGSGPCLSTNGRSDTVLRLRRSRIRAREVHKLDEGGTLGYWATT